MKGVLCDLHRAFLVGEGEGAGGAAARRAEAVAVAAAALLRRMATRSLTPAAMRGPQACQMVQLQMAVHSRATGRLTRNNGRLQVSLRQANPQRQLGAGTAMKGVASSQLALALS